MSNLFGFFKRKKSTNSTVTHASPIEIAYIEGFQSGLEHGLHMAQEVDKKVISRVREDAIQEALDRLNGNNKKTL